MKIFINGRFLTQKLTGVQKFAYQYTNALYKLYGNNITVLVPRFTKIDNDYSCKFQVMKIGIHSGHLWEQIDLPLYLKKHNNPKLINLTNSGPCFYKNSFSTIHDLSIYKNSSWNSFYYRNFYKLLIPLLLKNSKRIITVSNFSKNEIINRFSISESKIFVLYNFIEKNIFIKNELIIDKEYLLYIGSSNKRKNLKNLLSAFSQVDINNLGLKLVGVNIEDIDEKYSNFKNIECLGYVNNKDLIYYYRNAMVLISPSLYEGFGIPLIEAMVNDCPLLISDIEVYKEVCGDGAIYFDPYDIKDIRKNIEYFYNNHHLLRNKLINLTFKQLKKFDINKQVEILIKHIKSTNE